MEQRKGRIHQGENGRRPPLRPGLSGSTRPPCAPGKSSFASLGGARPALTSIGARRPSPHARTIHAA
eukprot:1805365-Pleurochrysis_carterae.AAC.1